MVSKQELSVLLLVKQLVVLRRVYLPFMVAKHNFIKQNSFGLTNVGHSSVSLSRSKVGLTGRTFVDMTLGFLARCRANIQGIW